MYGKSQSGSGLSIDISVDLSAYHLRCVCVHNFLGGTTVPVLKIPHNSGFRICYFMKPLIKDFGFNGQLAVTSVSKGAPRGLVISTPRAIFVFVFGLDRFWWLH